MHNIERQGSRCQAVDLDMVSHGYPALAAWIAQDPNNESLVFRKFDYLSARNLLHLQSQVISLEQKLKRYDEEMLRSSDMKLREAAMRWESLVKNAEDSQRVVEKERMNLYCEIQYKIKEYRT
jgi:hypothetical protein